MPSRTAIILLGLCCWATLAFAQQGTNAGTQQAITPPAARSVQMSEDDVRALRNDLARMKALVQQMETNLAFVSPTETPLKHQFQLEIDMWKTVIAHMERRVPATNAR
jgi:hypothetical protein